jgi:hypothetical protein
MNPTPSTDYSNYTDEKKKIRTENGIIDKQKELFTVY